jgi:Mn-containing catalase
VRGGVHQIAYARAVEKLTGADLSKMFPTPRIATEKIPECKPHIDRGDHLRLYRFSQEDYQELPAVFNGPNPETGEDLVVVDEAPAGVPPRDLPAQPAVFAPDVDPQEIAEIAKDLREKAGLPKEPTGLVADLKSQTKRSTRKATSRSKSPSK